MTQITFLQLLGQAYIQGANIARRADEVPAFLTVQFDAQPESVRTTALTQMTDNSIVKYGDLICALLMGSLNLSGAETEAFFTNAGVL